MSSHHINLWEPVGVNFFDAEEGGKASRLVANVQRWTAEVGGQVHIISYLLDAILPGRKESICHMQ